MLPTTAQFDAAADANTTEVDCRVEVEREFNTIADDITVTAANDAIDTRFHKDNIVNVRNPQRNGIAYGPVSEFFTSDDPLSAFRFIKDYQFEQNPEPAYFIPEDSGSTTRADVSIDYAENYTMNAIELRYENTRDSSTYYDHTINIYVTPDGQSEFQVYTGTMNDDGVTRIYFNGTTTWVEDKSQLDHVGENIRSIRFEMVENSYEHHPRIMYFGGLNIADISDDVIDLSIKKTEFEQSAFLPIGEPSGNTCDITLDNTLQKYRFGSVGSDYFMKNQRITVEFGLNTKYGGGADSFEYVNGGVFYVENYGYNEENMTANVDCQDRSKFLQETFCGNYVWERKSLKFIVHDLLSRSGITPNGVNFDFGVAANADETNLREYTWSHDEQTVWDFLSELAKSEFGTVFYDEEENLTFTDRLDIDAKFSDGVQYTINDTLNLESLDEQFVIGANKIKVNYETLGLNTTRVNPQIVYERDIPSYESGPQIPLNQVLWQPEADEGYLGSATLSRTLKPTHTHVYVTSDTEVQITRDEGEVLIGDEFITYQNRTTLGTGEGRLEIVERDARNTVYQGTLPVYKGINSNYDTKHFNYYQKEKVTWHSNPSRRMTADGWRQTMNTRSWQPARSMHFTMFESGQQNINQQFRMYSMRFRFNKIREDLRSDQAAGMFINMDKFGQFTAFEVSAPETDAYGRSSSTGNLRAFKGDKDLETCPMPPRPIDSEGNDLNELYLDTVLFEEAVEGLNEGTYIDITVLQISKSGRADRMVWYVNGNLAGQFDARYSTSYIRSKKLNGNEAYVGSRNGETGYIGLFTRGGTDVTVDYIYATNDTSVGPDELLQTRGFERYFDSGTDSWQVRNDYFAPKQYYVEFGAPVHEVVEYEGEHDVFPVLNARVLNTDEETVTVFKSSSNPFASSLLVGNTARIGVNLNDTVYYPDGSQIDHSFLVYGVPVVEKERDDITVQDAKSIRRYGEEEVEVDNPWINSRTHAVALGQHIRRFWADQQEFWEAEIMPNPALQVRDRIALSYTDKGFNGTDVWFVNGITLSYDGGLRSTLSLRRFEDYPPNAGLDYRDEGGIV